MKSIETILIMAIFTLFLSGCVEKEILDDINLIDGIGFDYVDGKKIRGTIVFPIFIKDKPPENRVLTGESLLKKEILQDIQLQAADPIVTGSMEVVLFSKELATKSGITELMDPFQRDPGVGSGIYLAVVEGETKELFEGKYGVRGNSTHISDIIDENIRNEDLPKTNLQIFLADFYSEGKSPFMPIIKKKSKDVVELTGVSFFNKGKLVETISSDKMFFFKLLVDKYSEGLHRVKIEEGEAAIRSIRSVHHYKLIKKNPMEVEVTIDVQGIINEFNGDKMYPNLERKLNKQFEKEINQECLALVKNFQEKNIDPIGFGHFVKTQIRGFDYKKWHESLYKDLVVKVKSNVEVTEAGVIQ
ncbi:Ger(x)C family spore germination protein [Caldibacillus lycopersici]|uniref:Ger(X)C family spore germination protein n=1 Tax=Perspicuibacillus lycopersici TaxID=1325689 RepID=A0AAE3IRL7_9BACI|nr:Ger(x)C family spore germination protein [Perspicuibacillus lycopersici]MCU9612393.1 Ger(x)C family spore germination protein [Perspicuibacillus lycopersici]